MPLHHKCGWFGKKSRRRREIALQWLVMFVAIAALITTLNVFSDSCGVALITRQSDAKTTDLQLLGDRVRPVKIIRPGMNKYHALAVGLGAGIIGLGFFCVDLIKTSYSMIILVSSQGFPHFFKIKETVSMSGSIVETHFPFVKNKSTCRE